MSTPLLCQEWRTNPLRVLKERHTPPDGITNGNGGTQLNNMLSSCEAPRSTVRVCLVGLLNHARRLRVKAPAPQRFLAGHFVLPERAILDFQLLGLSTRRKELPVTRCRSFALFGGGLFVSRGGRIRPHGTFLRRRHGAWQLSLTTDAS